MRHPHQKNPYFEPAANMDPLAPGPTTRILMADGKWLVPPEQRPKLAPPPEEHAPLPKMAEPERANCIW